MSDKQVLSIHQTRDQYKCGEITPDALTHDVLKRAVAENESLNAFCLLDAQTAMEMAEQSTKRYASGDIKSPLDGMIVTIKDWFDVDGWPTRMGSKTSASDIQKIDSPVVARLKEAGCILIGKTTLPEYGHKGVTDSPLQGITRNPWDTSKTCGGSSGGAAVAASIGAGHIHIGSDAGGSVRIPASFCGVVGFKPSPQVVASYPPSFFSSLSAIGPLSRSVSDVAEIMNVISKPDVRDVYAVPFDRPDFVDVLNQDIPDLKIGVARSIAGFDMLPDVADVFETAIEKMKPLGVVEDITLDMPNIISIFNTHWMAVAAQMRKLFSPEQQKEMDPRFLHWADRGDQLSLPDYLSALRQRIGVQEYFNDLFQKYDVIVTPTTAMTAFDVDSNMPRDIHGELWDDWTPFTYPANLARLPAISVPAGLTDAGLPVGLQIMAKPYADARLLQVAQGIEKALNFNETP